MSYQSKFYELPATIQSLVKIIVELAKPKRIILFGSRARGDHRENSDFDIAVSGRASSENDWTSLLLKVTEEPITLFKVDLVELEDLNDEYKENIKKEGTLLYEPTD